VKTFCAVEQLERDFEGDSKKSFISAKEAAWPDSYSSLFPVIPHRCRIGARWLGHGSFFLALCYALIE